MLLCVSLLVYGLLAWLMPQTYSDRLSTALDRRVQGFLAELEQVAFSESGGLFDQFQKNTDIYSVAIYNGNGQQVPLPTKKADDEWSAMIAVYAGDDSHENTPVLSADYYFSFSVCFVFY